MSRFLGCRMRNNYSFRIIHHLLGESRVIEYVEANSPGEALQQCQEYRLVSWQFVDTRPEYIDYNSEARNPDDPMEFFEAEYDPPLSIQLSKKRPR